MKKLVQGCALLMIAGSMMGNQSCENQSTSEARHLRRRVQMKPVESFVMQLPQGGNFNFGGVATEQLYTVLSETKSFSTATIDPAKIYDPAGLKEYEVGEFNQCDLGENDITNGISAKTTQNINASCLIEVPQGVIHSKILDFQLTNGNNGTISFANLLQSILNLGVSFDYKKYTLTMAMRAESPLEVGGIVAGDRRTITATTQQSYSKTMSGTIALGFPGFNVGTGAYYSSPLAGVVKAGLTQAVQDLSSNWDKDENWYGMVIKSCDNFIYINAGNGSDAGLVAGDIVRIQNVIYSWDGNVCKSNLMGTQDYFGGPVAYARIMTVGTTMSTAEVLKGDPTYPYSTDQIIHPGARVYMEKMYVAPKKTATK